MHGDLRNPWLVAVWPGMGKVALGAGSYLVEKLPAELLCELHAREFFDVEKVEFQHGVIKHLRMPRSHFYVWRNPDAERDLVIFVGEAQPGARRLEMCHRLLDQAEELGVRRVFTFAAMATKSKPKPTPRVFVVVNQAELLDEFTNDAVEILDDGQIKGLNGVLLVAAAERGMEGICLLGELPYVGFMVPNPRASLAILQLFSRHLGYQLDLRELSAHADAVDKGLLGLIKQMRRKAGNDDDDELPDTTEIDLLPAALDDADDDDDNDAQRAHIEAMFQAAAEDRDEAIALKEELDRLGLFPEYEDRFLDLFKSSSD